MKLHCIPPSPNTIKVVALANYLGIELEIVPVDVAVGAHRTPEFLTKNPNGLTPVLEDGDTTLWESNAIMFYLAQKAKSSLVPTDYKEQADMWRWIMWTSAHWNEPCGTFLIQRIVRPMFRGEQPDEQKLQEAEEQFKVVAGVLDAHLNGRKFLLGEQETIADFILAVNLVYTQHAAIPVAPYANIAAWFERVSALKGWQKAVPEMAAR
jgi:glutathione S-transferase